MAAAGLPAHQLAIGTPVEVRNRFVFSFSPGFEISGGIDDDYRVRRASDGVELPATFASRDIREADRSSYRWVRAVIDE